MLSSHLASNACRTQCYAIVIVSMLGGSLAPKTLSKAVWKEHSSQASAPARSDHEIVKAGEPKGVSVRESCPQGASHTCSLPGPVLQPKYAIFLEKRVEAREDLEDLC